MEEFSFHLTADEAAMLLRWHEVTVQAASRHGGGTQWIFPQEEWLLEKLRQPEKNPLFDDMDLEMFTGWMDKALFPHPAAEAVYFPGEEALYRKLKTLQAKYREFKEQKKRRR